MIEVRIQQEWNKKDKTDLLPQMVAIHMKRQMLIDQRSLLEIKSKINSQSSHRHPDKKQGSRLGK